MTIEAVVPTEGASKRGPIRILPPAVAARIAAGEVVEGPASVVKELVENALDAGARRVRVDVHGGGLIMIRVSDDGSGIPSNQLPLALARYATSKLADDDLAQVRTLGFRGEALPSIATVAELTIASRSDEERLGRRISVRFGRIVRDEPTAHPHGSTVTVRHLFEELPARLAASARPQTELAQIGQLARRLALAAPHVRFELVVDGRTALSTTGSGDMVNVAVEVYGTAIMPSLRALPVICLPTADIALVCCGGDVSRPSRGQVTFIVNGRWVQPRGLTAILEAAYRPLLPRGRHPVLIAAITVPTDRVDINVHPSKHEVRLIDEATIGAAIADHVRPAFGRQVRELDGRAWTWLSDRSRATDEGRPTDLREQGPEWEEEPAIASPNLPALRLIGQVQDRVIVVEGPGGIFLIDQHRAHERILYERLRAMHRGGGPEPVALAEPLLIELTPAQMNRFAGRIEALARLGFECEVFGGRTYLIRTIPFSSGYVPADGSVVDRVLGDIHGAQDESGLLANLTERDALTSTMLALADEPAAMGEDWLERLLVSLSCRSAVRRGRRLSRASMRAVIASLGHSSAPAVCPHGSPLLVHMSGQAIERQFGWR